MKQGPTCVLVTYGFKINKFISKCKNTNLQPFNQEVLQEKILTYYEEKHVQTLVVNLPQEKCYAKKSLPSTSVPPLKDQIPKLECKNQTSQV